MIDRSHPALRYPGVGPTYVPNIVKTEPKSANEGELQRQSVTTDRENRPFRAYLSRRLSRSPNQPVRP